MFVNDEQTIISQLKNINLRDNRNMQPKAERPPMCPRTQLPQLHLTPSGGGQKGNEGQQSGNNPWLLKPQHDIPATPPPQTDSKPMEFFPQRKG